MSKSSRKSVLCLEKNQGYDHDEINLQDENESDNDNESDHEDTGESKVRYKDTETSDCHDSIKNYLKEVSQYKLLNFEEEKELSRKIEDGDQDALNQLINSNLRLVIKIAKSFVSKDYPLIDVIQDGNIGLIRAAQKFDYRRNVRFSTYASRWIKQMIIRSLSQKKRIVRLPYRKEKALKKLKEFSSKYMSENKRYPTTAEISEELGIRPKEVETTKFSEITVSSLEESLNDENTFLRENVIGNTTFNPFDTLIRKDLEEETLRALDSLYPKEKTILIHRFGLSAEKRFTLKQMGDHFGISPETVRQIEIRTLKKLENSHTFLKGYIYQ